MHRPDAVTLHAQARRFRSRLTSYLVRSLMRAISHAIAKPRPRPLRPLPAR